MKKIIIHIGSGKTGSSSIQAALRKYKDKNEISFEYPVIAKSPGNQVLRFAFCDVTQTVSNVRNKYSGVNQKPAFKEYQEDIKNQFTSQCAKNNTVVISSEFWFLSSNEEVLSFRDFLAKLGFDEIHVVVYLRDPSKYYISVAQQALKNQHKMPKPNNFRYQMLEAIETWSSIEPKTLTVREFDRNQLKKQDIVADFQEYLSTVGVSSVMNLDTAFNETLTSEATQAIQDCYQMLHENKFNDQKRASYIEKIRMIIKSSEKVGNKPDLKKTIASFIYQRYYEEMINLRNKYGVFNEIVQAITPDIKNEFFPLEECNLMFFSELVNNFDMHSYKHYKSQLMV
jgi:hypothetical protein